MTLHAVRPTDRTAPPTITGTSTAPQAPPRAPQEPHTLRLHLLIILGYAFLTVVLTYPVAFRLTTEVPGGGDAWQNIWNLWWVKQALLVQHTNPYHTNLLYYPDGANLYFHTLVLTAGLMSLPLQIAGLNLVATYNIIMLLTFVLAGYCMFLLCMYLTRNVWASFIGGLVFSFSPYHFAHMFGHMNLVSLQWMPLYMLALLKAFQPGRLLPGEQSAGSGGTGVGVVGRFFTPALRWSLVAGALLALNAYTDWLYAVFMTLLTGIYAAWRLLLPSERRALGLGLRGWLEGVLRLVVVGATFLVVTAPILFPTLHEASEGYAQQPPLETLVYSADFISAFTPSELHPIWGKTIQDQLTQLGPYLPIKNPSERDVFLGYAVMGVAGVGLWRLRKRRAVRFWGVAAFVTWVFSLGPILQYAGKTQFTLFQVTVPLPYLILYKLPLFSIMRTPARLTAVTMLALGVLVAYAVANLLGAHRFSLRGLLRGRNIVFGALLPVAILFESLSTPFPTVPPGWNVPIYSKIAAEPGNFAILELPIRPFGDYMAYQTVHGKPIIGGYLARHPPYPALQQVPALHYLEDTTAADDPIRSQVANGQGTAGLAAMNVKYVIIRWWAFTADQKAAMQTKLSTLLPRPPDFSYPADQVDVWQIK